MAAPVGILFSEPQLAPLSLSGKIQPGCYRKFFFSQTTQQAPVYRDGKQSLVFTQPVQSDNNGRFAPVYLDPTITYRSQLYNSIGELLEDEDPYVTPPPFTFAKVKLVATNRVSTIVAAADPELQITIPGPGTYVFDALCEFITTGASGATPGVVVTPAFSGAFRDNTGGSFSIIGNMNATGVDNFGSMNGSGSGAAGLSAVAYSLAGTSALNTIMFRGVFKATEAGILSINWAQQTSSATATTLNAGSYIRYVGFGQGTDVSKGSGRPPVINPFTIQTPNTATPAVFIATYALAITQYIYSKDGTSWKVGNFPTSNISNAAYGGPASGPFWLVVTQSQTVFKSLDGITWTTFATAMPNANQWNDVCWSPTLQLFVAINNNGTNQQAATSPDGVTWTLRSTPTGSFNWNSVIWAPTVSLFVAVNGTGNSTTNVAMTSPDGITWTGHNTALACTAVYARDLGGSFGIFGLSSGAGTFAKAPDGVTWSKGTVPSMPISGGNSFGGVWVSGGTAYQVQNKTLLDKTTVADLQSGWTNISDVTGLGISGGLTLPAAIALYAPLGMWAFCAGPALNTQIVTVLNSTSLTVYNPTNAVNSVLQKMAAAF